MGLAEKGGPALGELRARYAQQELQPGIDFSELNTGRAIQPGVGDRNSVVEFILGT